MTKSMISKRESGEVALEFHDMHQIARALECAWWDLAPLKDAPVNPRERALVELYRDLAEDDRATVFASLVRLRNRMTTTVAMRLRKRR